MNREEAEALAALHARCFVMPRPWSAEEFVSILAQRGAVLVSRPEGFAVGRVAGPEAELLTLAVDPDQRRRGIGRHLLQGFEHAAREGRAVEALLEVAAENTAAIGLYTQAGYAERGRRRAYYLRPDGAGREDAIVMGRRLG